MLKHEKKKWSWERGVTREELAEAMKVYLEKGGQIKVLKPEYASSAQTIGSHAWDSYGGFDDDPSDPIGN